VQDVQSFLVESRLLFHPLQVARASVQLPGLSARETSDLEVRLNVELRECGCNSGSVWGAIGILVYCALTWVFVGGPSAWRWKHLPIGIVFALAAAVVGKLFGRLRARIRLSRKLQWLLEDLRAFEAPGKEE
jgi:hypothetical protein